MKLLFPPFIAVHKKYVKKLVENLERNVGKSKGFPQILQSLQKTPHNNVL